MFVILTFKLFISCTICGSGYNACPYSVSSVYLWCFTSYCCWAEC